MTSPRFTPRRVVALSIGGSLLLAGLAVWYFRANTAVPQAAPVVQTPAPAPAAKPSAVPAPSAPKVAEDPASPDSPEVAATARMYAAHAPLRTPEVANPDSQTNKQILQTMVLKALAQGPTPPPTKN